MWAVLPGAPVVPRFGQASHRLCKRRAEREEMTEYRIPGPGVNRLGGLRWRDGESTRFESDRLAIEKKPVSNHSAVVYSQTPRYRNRQ